MTLVSLDRPSRSPLARLTARAVIATLLLGLTPAPAPAALPRPGLPLALSPSWLADLRPATAAAPTPSRAVAAAAPIAHPLIAKPPAVGPATRLAALTAAAVAPARPVPLAALPAAPAPSQHGRAATSRAPASAPRSGGSPENLVTRTHTFAAGWNLVSVPLLPTNPSPTAVFADVPAPLYLYDYVSGFTLGVGEPNYPNVGPGRAYWMLLPSGTTIDVDGDVVGLGEFRRPLTVGWNAIANPWLTDVAWADSRVSVKSGATTLSLAAAIGQGWIEGGLTGHDPLSNTATLIPANGSGQLEPWKGYFLYAAVAAELLFSPPPYNSVPPQASITDPLSGATLTEPTPILGTIVDDNLVDWRLEYAPAGSTTYTLLAQGQSPVNGTLATFDPTLLLNGVYSLRLSATDMTNITATHEISVVVSGNLKVGNFSVSFVDLEVPVAGIPIRVTRTYDSRDTRRGDFGHGWRLDLSNVKISQTGATGLGWEGTVTGVQTFTYCLGPTRVHVVSVTFPDGKVYEFEPVVPPCSFNPIRFFTMAFNPRPGTAGTLEPLGNAAVSAAGSYPGPMSIFDYTGNLYDAEGYKLTLPDGRAFVVSRSGGLQSITDLNGNVLTVGPGGISHSSGIGVTFLRDGLGRITTITDPLGNTLGYTYDANGDLETFTDREQHTTRFSYDPAHPHFLSAIEDPLGRTPIRNEYDDDGRLIRHTDAFGKTIEYTHNIAGREEIVTDRNGGVRRLIYDERGNVLEETDPEGKVTTRTYDARNNRLTEKDPNNHTTTYTYDAADNVTSVEDALSNRTEYTYNDRRQVLTVKDARDKVTTNTYDPLNGNLLTTKDALNNVTRFTYNTQGNVLTQTMTVDGVDQVTTYTYDTAGRMLTAKDALNHITTYTYNLNGERLTQVTTRTTPSGAQTLNTTYEYDHSGHLTKTIDADLTFTRTVYDELGRPKESYDKLNRQTTTEYDEMGRLVKTIHPDLTFESSTYDNEGRRLTSRDRGGRVTGYTYDDVGRMKRTTYPDTKFTENTYDPAGRLIEVLDARGHTTAYGYDDANRRTLVRNPLNHETHFTYDENGNQKTVTDARSNTTTYHYDDVNRRTRTTFPDTSFSVTGYDSLGRRTTEMDQAGKTTSFGYDAVGRLIRVTDARGKNTTYGYDEVGNRISQTDANTHATLFEYDALGRETKRTLPGGAFETKGYDDAGSLTSRTDFMGRTITQGYHPLTSRLTSITYPTSPATTASFTYTPTGRRLTAVDGRGTTGYIYDNRDRLTSLTYPDGRRLDYGYDGTSNRTSLVAHIGGTTLAFGYAYDDANRLDTVTDPLMRVYDHGYDATGNRTSLAYPNLTTTAYTYNTLNRLTNLTTTGPGGIVQGYAFTLGASGNRTQIDEADGSVRVYGYDDLYRLTTETVTGTLNYGKTFTYDDVGNRMNQLTTGQGAANVDYVYDTRDRLITEGGATLTYDNNGNLTGKTADGTVYTWDLENRLIGVTKPDGTMVGHVYDVDGVRVQTTTTLPANPAVTVNYLVDTSSSLSHVVAETDAAGAVQAYYVRGDDLLAVVRGSGTRFMHADGIGSIRRLTDDTGAATDSYTYTAFGELLAHTGTDSQPYAFAGEPLDPNIGFQFHRARWMNPSTGRFTGIDPFKGWDDDPRTLHRYGYAAADPANATDPTGQDFLTTFTVVGIIATLAAAAYLTFLPRSERPLLFGGGLRVVAFDWKNKFILPSRRGGGGVFFADVLSSEEISEVKFWTYQTMRLAYSGLAVAISEGGGTNQMVINQDYPDNAGDTRPFARTSDVNFNQLAGMARKHTPPGTPRNEFIAALGRGIGATAAHEFAHQVGGDHQNRDAFAYDYYAADVPQHFYGQLHWTDPASMLLQQKLRY